VCVCVWGGGGLEAEETGVHWLPWQRMLGPMPGRTTGVGKLNGFPAVLPHKHFDRGFFWTLESYVRSWTILHCSTTRIMVGNDSIKTRKAYEQIVLNYRGSLCTFLCFRGRRYYMYERESYEVKYLGLKFIVGKNKATCTQDSECPKTAL
jgi:hypothetical protein